MLSFLTDLINENMEWTEIKTNDKMNQTLKDCLEMQKDNISLYARKYIEELECEVKKLSKADVIKSVCDQCKLDLKQKTWNRIVSFL